MAERRDRGGVRARIRSVHLRRLFVLTSVIGLLGAAPARADQNSDAPQPDAGNDASEKENDDEFTWEDEDELFDVEEDREEDDEGEETETEQERRRRDVPLRKMSKDQARAAGFDFGDEREASRQTTGVFLASTAGIFLHGIGHWWIDDARTAAFLVGTEGIALTLAGAGAATWFTEGDTPVGATVGSSMFQIGAGLFGISYLLDVVGTLRGTSVQVPADSADRRRIAIVASYRYLGARRYPLNHHFDGGIEFDFGSVFGHVGTDQEFALNASTYGGELGARWWRGPRPYTFAYALADVQFLDFRGAGPFDRWRGDLRLGMSVDLGLVSPHFEQVAVGLEAGYGRSWYLLDVPTRSDSQPVSAGYVPVNIYSQFNLSERIHTRVEYERAPGRRLQSTRRLGGIGSVELLYNSTDLLDLKLGADFGGGIGVTGGLVLNVL